MTKIPTIHQPRNDAEPDSLTNEAIEAFNDRPPFIELASAHDGEPSRSAQTKLRGPTAAVLEQLSGALAEVTEADHPRTFRLLQSGRNKLSRKLIEEACEVTVEVARRDPGGVIRESADLLYHLIVLWFQLGIEPVEIWSEMQARAGVLGIAEKRPKRPGRNDLADE